MKSKILPKYSTHSLRKRIGVRDAAAAGYVFALRRKAISETLSLTRTIRQIEHIEAFNALLARLNYSVTKSATNSKIILESRIGCGSL